MAGPPGIDTHGANSARAVNAAHYSSWNLKSIELINSSITSHWIFALHNSRVTATNSTVNFNLYDQSDVVLKDSRIFWIHAYCSSGSVTFENAAMGETPTPTFTEMPRISFYSSKIFLSGEINFSDPIILAWVSSNVTRNYGLTAVDTNGSLIENAELTLFDRHNVSVWNGLTDSLGGVVFNSTFIDNNYTHTLRLEAAKSGFASATQNVTFLSNTPVTVVMHELLQGDINQDSTVDILDAIIIANSFSSQPGTSRWNPKADLNSDGIVDIYDAIPLANNYGKTA